jgi:hypothetical protein
MSDQQPAKKPFDKRIAGAAVAAQIVVGFFTLRDIKRRGKDGVRGPRIIWAIWGGTNTLGSAMYWIFGRRRHPKPLAED